ncbi:MAG: hypothetical protein SFU98_13650 [Leptospiraceae bacterium]|nr:hypothetical protein [Leptospiraceae bacterium]
MNESIVYLIKNIPNLISETISYLKEKENTKKEQIITEKITFENITEREKSKDNVSIFKSIVDIELAKYEYFTNRDTLEKDVKLKELELKELELLRKTDIIKEIISMQQKSSTYRDIENDVEARKSEILKYLGK